ncbi:hypothetical protein MCACP_04830 [Neomoorella carbonis]
MLKNFKVAIYEIVMEAGAGGLTLPPYKGSTLRGGFGRVFHRITCSGREGHCRECLLQGNCPSKDGFYLPHRPGAAGQAGGGS